MRRRISFGFILITLLSSAYQARGEDLPTSLSLILSTGGYSLSSQDNLKSGIGYDIRLGYDIIGRGISDSIGIEGGVSYIPTKSSKDDSTVDAFLVRGDAIYSFFPRKRIVPFLSVGGGALITSGSADSTTTPLFAYGAGMKYFLKEYLALRLDLRHNLLYDQGLKSDFQYTAGVSMSLFRDKKLKRLPVVDSDGDGVPDDTDRCPATPKGVKVDKNGCPSDADGDGVADSLDKCPDTPKGVAVDKKGCPLEQLPPVPPAIQQERERQREIAEQKRLEKQKELEEQKRLEKQRELQELTPAPEPKPEVKPEPKPEVAPEGKPEAKPEGTPATNGAPAKPATNGAPVPPATNGAKAAPATNGAQPQPKQAQKAPQTAPPKKEQEPRVAAPALPAAPAVPAAPAAPAATAKPVVPSPSFVQGAPSSAKVPRPALRKPLRPPAAPVVPAPQPEPEKHSKLLKEMRHELTVPTESERAKELLVQAPAPRPQPAPQVKSSEIASEPTLSTLKKARKVTSQDKCPDTPLEELVQREHADMTATVLFKTDSAEVSPRFLPRLQEIAEFARAHRDLPVYIEGHADNHGSPGYNLQLSLRRVKAIKEILVSRFKLQAAKMVLVGKGCTIPVDDNRKDNGRAKNRRVIIEMKQQ